MPDADPNTYSLTVRAHRDVEGRFEYVLSVPGAKPAPSDMAYETYEAARDAGHALGRDMGLDPAPTSA